MTPDMLWLFLTLPVTVHRWSLSATKGRKETESIVYKTGKGWVLAVEYRIGQIISVSGVLCRV